MHTKCAKIKGERVREVYIIITIPSVFMRISYAAVYKPLDLKLGVPTQLGVNYPDMHRHSGKKVVKHVCRKVLKHDLKRLPIDSEKCSRDRSRRDEVNGGGLTS